MLLTTRKPPGPGAERWIYPKIVLFVAGASTGLIGIAAHIDWLINVAIAILAAGFILKLIGSRQAHRESDFDNGDAEQ
jgi:hypothetical protein